jgi:hypothetical protein
MKNLRALLQESDPVRDDPALSTTDAREIRRAMLGAVETVPSLFFPRTVPVAALVVVMIVAGATAGRRLTNPPLVPTANGGQAVRPGARSVSSPGSNIERRQVRFATPGGTRIIWTIDPNFQMREVMP